MNTEHDRMSKRGNWKHGESPKMRQSAEYKTWLGIKSRCYSQSTDGWKRYGAKGVTVCERWLYSFENFLSDMGRRPEINYTIERRDNSKGYSPENCKWATPVEQANNKTSNHFLEFQGQRMTIAQWEAKLGINRKTIKTRLTQLGWSTSEALAKPVRQGNYRLSKKR